MIEPLDLVFIAADRIQEAIDDAVARGRVTRGDANDLVSDLVRRGREQTDDVLGNLDELLGRGIDQLESLSRKLEEASAKVRGADALDALVEKVRQAANGGGSGVFPVEDYDGMSVPRVKAALAGLDAAELRTVRAYEAANANRRAVIAAIDRALG